MWLLFPKLRYFSALLFVGLTSAFSQSTIQSDDFRTGSLNTSLWTFINPGTPSTLNFSGVGTQDARLNFVVPAGSSHDVWSGGNFAPRIMQSCNNADFEVEVKFESPMTAGYQIQGVLVQESATKFIRFDFVRDFSGVRAFAASFNGGTPTTRYDQYIGSSATNFLRVRRVGNQWTSSYSFNGTTWTNAANFSFTLVVSSVGPFAGNAGGSPPAFTSLVDYFFNTASPIVPEDPTAPPSPPTITTQPVSQNVSEGQAATFSIIASGSFPLSYQWQKNAANISGATNASYTISSATIADSGAVFRCIVANTSGSDTSDVAVLSVNRVPPSITQQPTNQSANVGLTATFSVSAIGSAPLTFQWQKNLASIVGATNSSYTTPPTLQSDSGATFRCIVGNALGTVTSNSATLSVTTTPTGIVSDDFRSSPLNASRWAFINPRNDATVTITGVGTTDALLNISVPAGLSHDVWSDGNFAPRIMQSIPNVDFECEVKFQSPQTIGYQIQGVMVQQDAANFIRFDFVRFPSDLRIFAATFSGGSPSIQINETIAPAGVLYLRVKRLGNQWTQSYSTNGTTWTNAANFTHALNVSSIGPFAGNAGGNAPAFTSLVDYFFNTSAPLIPEDPTGPPPPPTIMTQPMSQSVSEGSAASFAVVASGQGTLSYVWQKNNIAIVGATNSSYTIPSTTFADSGATFACIVSNAGGSVTSNAAILSVNRVAPTISVQPTNRSVVVGDSARFSIVAAGSPVLAYQWQRDSINIAGATNSSYTLATTVLADSGARFRCIVSNGIGTVTSNAALLSVSSGVPLVTTHPSNQVATEGQTASFIVAASGALPLSYQWQKNGANISGATNAAYTTPTTTPADSGATFRCIISNSRGTITSNAALLIVNRLPSGSIVSDDFNAASLNTSLWTFINPGAPSTLSLTGTGTQNALLSIAIAAGSAHDAWSTGNMAPRIMQTINNTDFDVEVKFQSQVALAYQLQGIIVQQDSANYLRFDVYHDGSSARIFAASFENGAPTVRRNNAISASSVFYLRVKREGNQWTQSYSFNGTTWTDFPAFTHALTVSSIGPFVGNAGSPAPAFTGLVDYFFNRAAPLVPEDGDRIPPTINNVAVTTTTNSATITWTTNEPATSSVAYGVTTSYGDSAGNATRVISHSVTINSLLPNTTYHFRISSRDSTGNVATTNDATFATSAAGVTITQEPVDRFVAVGQAATFSVRASGTLPFAFQWQRNDTTIVGATDSLYTTASTTLADSGATYRCIVSNAVNADTSVRALLRVALPPSVTSEPLSQTVFEGDSATFLIVASGSNPLSYRWQRNSVDIVGATNSSYTKLTAAAADSGAAFRCIVTNVVAADTSVAAVLSVNVPVAITLQPANATVAVGQTAAFVVRARGTLPISYQWQKNDTTIVGATDTIYTTLPTTIADSGFTFRCIVTNAFRSDTSSRAVLSVASLPSIVDEPDSIVRLVGETAVFFVFAAGSEPLAFQWQKNGANIVGATDDTLTTTPVSFGDDGLLYRCIVSNAVGRDTSRVALLSVNAPPTIINEPSSSFKAVGQASSFFIAAAGSRPFTYEWLKNDTTVVGAVDSFYVIPSTSLADSGARFVCVVSNSHGADTSVVAILNVGFAPAITDEPDSQTVVEGQSATFTIVADGSAPFNYQWLRNGVVDSTTTSATYVATNLLQSNDSTRIQCIVANAYGRDTSAIALVRVNVPATVIAEPSNTTVAVGQTATFAVMARGNIPISFRWLKNDTTIVGATNSIYTTPMTTLADSGARFACIIENAFGADTSVAALLRVLIPPQITIEPTNQTAFAGTPASFNITATGSDTLTYQWERDGVTIAGATNRIYTLTTVLPDDSGDGFRCITRNAVGADTSAIARLFVLPLPAQIISDDFSAPALNPALWTFINPGAPSTLALVGTGTTDAHVTMTLAAGANHDVWSDGILSPRLMQAAPNSNFEVEAKFQSQQLNAYQLQGIVVEQDSANYIRFDVYHDGGSPRVFATTFTNRNPTVRYDQAIATLNPLYLRVKRVGNQWTQSYSANGTTWTTAASFTHTLTVRSIGPFFGNAGFPEETAPEFTGVLDYFFNTASRIVPEDSVRIPLAPKVVTQPTNRLVVQGRTATFVVGASGSLPITFQWQKNGSNIVGATNATYITPPTTLADSGRTFRCVISNSAGTVTSNAALLIVRSTLVGTMAFVNRIVDENSPRHAHCKTVGDVDGDGYADIIAAGAVGYDDGVYWYKYPTWAKYKIHSGSFSTDMQAADLDGDGDLDITLPKGSDLGTSVWWYENPLPNGDPANGNWVEHFLGNTLAHDVEIGDVNADGKPDIVVRYGGATMFLSDSLATTWQQVSISGRWSEGIALGDLDSDGDLDVGMNGAWQQNPLPLGDPADPEQWTYRIFDNSWEHHAPVHAVDLNDDGRTDLMIGAGEHTEIKRLYWYEQPASVSGAWIKHVVDTTLHDMHTIKTADMNNDGLLDIITAEMYLSDDPDEVVIFLNEGNGTWTKTRVDAGGGHNLRVFDLGNDGDLDIMSTNTGEAVDGSPVELWENLLVQKTHTLDVWERHVVDSARQWQSQFITAGDVDNDRRLDIVTGGWWYKNPGVISQQWIKDTVGAPLNNVALVHDFDLDGRLDIFGSRGQGLDSNANFAWAQNLGNGNFSVRTNIQTGQGDYLQGAAVRRFGIDTEYEIALSWNNAVVGVQMLTVPNNPASSQWGRRQISATSQGGDLSAKDIQPDRNVDLMLGTKWLRSEVAGYTAYQLFSFGALQPSRNRVADINGDGKLDAIVSYKAVDSPGRLAWYEQPASPIGLWTEHIISTSVIGPMSLDVADMDSDGDIDVIVGEHFPSHPDSARLLIFENTNSSWTQHLVYTGDAHYHGAQVFDIDGDGDRDIISTGLSNGNVVVYENRSLDSGGTRPAALAQRKKSVVPSINTSTDESLPKEFALYQNYPNPFNPTTTIRYDVPKDGNLTLKIFNMIGQEVATLVNENQKAGRYTHRFDASRYASGVYFYRMQASGFVSSKKMIVVK